MTPAQATTATTSAPAAIPGAPAPGPLDFITGTPLPLLIMFVALFYFMILRPQQAQRKAHQALIADIKRGDTVVLSNGMIGKVAKVDETELGVEIATGVVVNVVRSMVSDVRGKTAPVAANDAKPAKTLSLAKPSAKPKP